MCCLKVCFNSILVRLKEAVAEFQHTPIYEGFNSILVRLKAGKVIESAVPTTRFNSILVRLKVETS